MQATCKKCGVRVNLEHHKGGNALRTIAGLGRGDYTTFTYVLPVLEQWRPWISGGIECDPLDETTPVAFAINYRLSSPDEGQDAALRELACAITQLGLERLIQLLCEHEFDHE